ncbi:MAG: DUF4339 domain-containing protein [Deltaproteobacteria bacterium]|nr:DUF4339 domain-containing protein [Deltaproteobacteria bacterium]
MKQFYIRIGTEQEKGPFTMDQLRSMWENGAITADALYRPSDATEWRQLAAEFVQQAPMPQRNEKRPRRTSSPLFLIVALLTIIVLFVGSFHFVTGSSLPGPQLMRRDSFGLSEFFVDVDAITGMPWLAAKARFPLGCRLLQREGILESDTAFNQRVQEETRREFDRTMREAERETQRLLRDAQRYADDY